MFKIGTCLLLALSAWSLWDGSLAEDLQSGHVCLIDEPIPNQCESFCLHALRPLLSETKSQLDELEGQQVKMEERLRNQHQAAQNKIEGKLQAVQSKVEEVQGKLMEQQQTDQTKVDEVQAKLERDLLAVKTILEGQQALLTKIEIQLQTVIDNNQAAMEEIPERITKKIPMGFQRIGERYFRIIYDYQDWYSAAEKCREMGGYLAAFRDQKEVDAVRAKLNKFRTFWTGINDLDTKDQFVSVASNKSAKLFVPFSKTEGNDNRCIFITESTLQDWDCDALDGYICQLDNET